MSPINENVVCSETSRVDETLNDLMKTSESKNRDVFVASPQGSKHTLIPRLLTQEKFRDEANMNSSDDRVLDCLTPDEAIDRDETTVEVPPTDITEAYSSPEPLIPTAPYARIYADAHPKPKRSPAWRKGSAFIDVVTIWNLRPLASDSVTS